MLDGFGDSDGCKIHCLPPCQSLDMSPWSRTYRLLQRSRERRLWVREFVPAASTSVDVFQRRRRAMARLGHFRRGSLFQLPHLAEAGRGQHMQSSAGQTGSTFGVLNHVLQTARSTNQSHGRVSSLAPPAPSASRKDSERHGQVVWLSAHFSARSV